MPDPESQQAVTQLLEFFDELPLWSIYAVTFLLLVGAGCGVPIPEDLTIVVAGFLCYKERLDLVTTYFICVFGTVVGDCCMYSIGRLVGGRLTKYKWFQRVISPKKLQRSEKLLRRHGAKVVLGVRFLPGLRGPTYFTTGTLRYPLVVFATLDFVAALVSTPIIIGLVFAFGEEVERAIQSFRNFQYVLLGLVAVFLSIFFVRLWLAARSDARSAGAEDADGTELGEDVDQDIKEVAER